MMQINKIDTNSADRKSLVSRLDVFFSHIENKNTTAVFSFAYGVSVKLGEGFIKMIMRDKSAPESYRFVCFSDAKEDRGDVYSVPTNEIGSSLLREIIDEIEEKVLQHNITH